MVSFSNISKSYGDQIIFDDLNLTVQPGEFVFIIGRSGAGKLLMRGRS
jgi:ABC-type sugar transport system ATPase subunit